MSQIFSGDSWERKFTTACRSSSSSYFSCWHNRQTNKLSLPTRLTITTILSHTDTYTDILTHRYIHKQIHAHTDTYTIINIYTQIHQQSDTYTKRYIHKQIHPHTDTYTIINIYTQIHQQRDTSTNIYIHKEIQIRMYPWCNGNCHWKWTWWSKFKSWMNLFSLLGKNQLFSLQLWENSRENWAL